MNSIPVAQKVHVVKNKTCNDKQKQNCKRWGNSFCKSLQQRFKRLRGGKNKNAYKKRVCGNAFGGWTR